MKESARAEQGTKGSLVSVNLNPLHLLDRLCSSIRNSGNEVDVVASLIKAQAVGRQDALCATDLALKIGIRDDQKVQQVPFFCNRVVLSNRWALLSVLRQDLQQPCPHEGFGHKGLISALQGCVGERRCVTVRGTGAEDAR